MINIVLMEPEIPPNTGNIIRLAANTGCNIHLIEPLGFTLDDKRLRRAGLDYEEWCNMVVHKSWADFINTSQPERLFAIETNGEASFFDIDYQANDFLLFGSETKGLSSTVLQDPHITNVLRIPMRSNSRSMNLSNAVAVVAYESWRQMNFNGAV